MTNRGLRKLTPLKKIINAVLPFREKNSTAGETLTKGSMVCRDALTDKLYRIPPMVSYVTKTYNGNTTTLTQSLHGSALSDNIAVTVYDLTGPLGYAKILTIDSTGNVTEGIAKAFTSTAFKPYGTCKISNNSFCVVGGVGTALTAVIGTYTGTGSNATITWGSEYTLDASPASLISKCVLLASGYIAVATNGYPGKTYVMTFSGTTISASTVQTLNAGSSSAVNLIRMTDTSYIVSSIVSSTPYAAVCLWDGVTITVGAAYSLGSGNSASFSLPLDRYSDTEFFSCVWGTPASYTRKYTISGTTLSYVSYTCAPCPTGGNGGGYTNFFSLINDKGSLSAIKFSSSQWCSTMQSIPTDGTEIMLGQILPTYSNDCIFKLNVTTFCMLAYSGAVMYIFSVNPKYGVINYNAAVNDAVRFSEVEL